MGNARAKTGYYSQLSDGPMGISPQKGEEYCKKINEQSFRIFDSFNEDFENPPNKIKKLLEISLTFAHNIVIYHLWIYTRLWVGRPAR